MKYLPILIICALCAYCYRAPPGEFMRRYGGAVANSNPAQVPHAAHP